MSDLNRQGLLVWMRNVVEQNKCQGVEWENEDEDAFKIPWGNQKSRCWKEEDCTVFLEYAKYTGKYKAGDKPDFPKWKQNLKSAINKNRFIERLKHRDHLGGTKPYRVYRFTDRDSGSKKKPDGPRLGSSSSDVTDMQGLQHPQSHFDEGGNVTCVTGSCPSRHNSSESSLSRSLDSRNEIKSSSPSSSPGLDFLCSSPFSPVGRSRDEACDQQSGNIPNFIADEDISTAEYQNTHNVAQNIEINNSNPMAVTTATPMPLILTQTNIQGSPQSYSIVIKTTGNQTQFLAPCTSPQADSLIYASVPSTCGNQQSVPAQLFEFRPPTTSIPQSSIQDFIDPSRNQRYVPESDSYMPLHSNVQISSSSVAQNAFIQPAQANVDLVGATNSPVTNNDIVMQETSSFSRSEIPQPMLIPLTSMSVPSPLPQGATSSFQQSSLNASAFNGPQFQDHRSNTGELGPCQGTQIPQQLNDVEKKDQLIHLQILYGTPHRVVNKTVITSPLSRIFFGIVPHKRIQEEIQGPAETQQIKLPEADDLNIKDDKKTKIRDILANMDCGVFIIYRDGDIFVERKCLPHVYLSDGVKESTRLPRSSKKRPNVETKAFDFKAFQAAAERHKQDGTSEVPRDHFLLTFGHQILQNDDSPTRSVPMYAVVRHVQAAKTRYSILGDSAMSSTNTMMSNPDSFDLEITLAKEMSGVSVSDSLSL